MARLELKSQFGDQSYRSYRNLIHWTTNATETVSALDSGLEFTEGQPVFSTSLIRARDLAEQAASRLESVGSRAANGEPGSLLICAVPANYHLGYGVFTTAYIDRQGSAVEGSALSYADGRKRLALYSDLDVELARLIIESDITGGYVLRQHPRVRLDPRFILGQVAEVKELERLAAGIDTATRNFAAFDIERTALDLARITEPVSAQTTPSLAAALEELVNGTVEAVVISMLRVMRWQGLSLQGYKFFEGLQELRLAPVKDYEEQKRRMEDLGTRVATSKLLVGSLAWLKDYVDHEMAVMKVELRDIDS